MSGLPSVRPARAEEADAAAALLTDAFVDEAGLNYWLRQGTQKDRARRLFFDRAVRDTVHPQRDLWVAEAGSGMQGAAIWLKPGLHAYDFSPWRQLVITPLLYRIAGVRGSLRGLALGEELERLHPPAPHAHLVFLGVSPQAQGQGIGSAILKHTLAPLDAEGVPAMLEATTERNVALYRRHGFEVARDLHLPGLHLRLMLRSAQR